MDQFLDLNENIPALRDKASRLPLQPGVYLMKNSTKNIIYIGKAKVLKNRVNQYFHCFGNLTPKTIKLVSNIDDFDYIVTSSEFEALLLELNLIKQYRPKYNILLKDDKGVSFIKITPPPWSKILAVHRQEDDGSEYIGPFPSSYTVHLMVDQAIAIFGLPTCNRVFGEKDTGRPCLNYFIKQCYGPCKRGNNSPERHAELIGEVKKFFRDGDREIVKNLTEQMEQAAESLDFEKAATLRDRLNAIENIRKTQSVIDTTTAEADVFGLTRGNSQCCFAVLSIRKSRIADKENFFIDDTASENAQASQLRADFLLGYYANKQEIPKKIFIDGDCEDKGLLEELLSQKRGSKVSITLPQKGEGVRLIQMAANNAFEQLTQVTGKQRESGMLSELSKLVGIEKLNNIESYDISNTSGADNIAGMVVFIDGKPQKSHYRQFIIRGFTGQDDYGSLREAVKRRYTRFVNHTSNDAAFSARPDLILADGGQGQVSAVKDALAELELTDIPVLGMVKDSRHTTRALVDEHGNEIEIKSARGAFTLVSTIQEEVHRYVITCHRNRRSRRTTASVLANIPGIGDKRITALMEAFKTIESIAKASVEELAAVKGMSKQAAERTKRFFEEEY
ncbi:MAG TPA: excinuclease ABC subunit UvrC [Oscillospiraceae bacterium]|nr:excinuclease ABC subunit UvrC [Oscillospiraceae bacterium]HPS34657.1 excinuclease ABC subunit UvrC [Oscillospiraceae bacterium]